MAVAAHYHTVQGEGDGILRTEAVRVGGHELSHRPLEPGTVVEVLGERVALAEYADDLPVLDHQQTADVPLAHRRERLAHRRLGSDRGRFRRVVEVADGAQQHLVVELLGVGAPGLLVHAEVLVVAFAHRSFLFSFRPGIN